MPLYLVAYDLDKPGQDYSDLYDDLNAVGASRIQDSVWALKGDWNVEALQQRLHAHLDSNDRLLVVRFGAFSSIKGMAKIKDL